jgi:hypothetical protein
LIAPLIKTGSSAFSVFLGIGLAGSGVGESLGVGTKAVGEGLFGLASGIVHVQARLEISKAAMLR